MVRKRLRFSFNFSYFLTAALVVFVIWRQYPVYEANMKKEGQSVPSNSYELLSGDEKVVFPTQSRSLAIFWATWCAPCKLEMARLKKSVDDGNIKSEQIFAINMGEDKKIVKQFLREAPYPFTFIDAPLLPKQIDIQMTPTVVMFEGEKMIKVSSGVSFFGIWQAEFFLNR